MTRMYVKRAILGAVLVGLVSADAYAWGPKAQHAIAATAVQRLQQKLPKSFENDRQRYWAEVIKGRGRVFRQYRHAIRHPQPIGRGFRRS